MAEYATRVEESWEDDDVDAVMWRERLAVVDAETPEQAQEISGLVMEDFHPATGEELDEWNEICDEPLDTTEAGMLIRLVRRELRRVGRQRLRDRATGRWGDKGDESRDANRKRSRRLVRVLGKLEAIRGDSEQSALE